MTNKWKPHINGSADPAQVFVKAALRDKDEFVKLASFKLEVK